MSPSIFSVKASEILQVCEDQNLINELYSFLHYFQKRQEPKITRDIVKPQKLTVIAIFTEASRLWYRIRL